MVVGGQVFRRDRRQALIDAARAAGERLRQLLGRHTLAKMHQAAALQFEDQLGQIGLEDQRDVPDDIDASGEHFGIQFDDVWRGIGDAAGVAVADVDNLGQDIQRMVAIGPKSPSGCEGRAERHPRCGTE